MTAPDKQELIGENKFNYTCGRILGVADVLDSGSVSTSLAAELIRSCVADLHYPPTPKSGEVVLSITQGELDILTSSLHLAFNYCKPESCESIIDLLTVILSQTSGRAKQ